MNTSKLHHLYVHEIEICTLQRELNVRYYRAKNLGHVEGMGFMRGWLLVLNCHQEQHQVTQPNPCHLTQTYLTV